jgi:hypothetical protein
MKQGAIIRASEIGQYAYCARAWWLGRVRGLAPVNVEELVLGRGFHAQHGRLVASTLRLRRSVLVLVGLAVLCLILALLLGGGQ